MRFVVCFLFLFFVQLYDDFELVCIFDMKPIREKKIKVR